MKRSIELRTVVVAAVVVFAFAMSGLAQQARQQSPVVVSGSPKSAPPQNPITPSGTLFIPKSSLPPTVPPGHSFAAHTNIQIVVPNGLRPDQAPPFPEPYGVETPSSVACHYGLVSTSAYPNCNPASTTVNPTGGSKSIAVVDAYDDPSAPGDLAWFSVWFGLPLSPSQFQVVWANTYTSSCPGQLGYGVPLDDSGGWELEESLDIEWAHAMAPNATLYLVEACSNYDTDLQQAVLVANNLVQCGNSEINPSTFVLGTCPGTPTGKGEVSMSWGGDEFADETSFDANFPTPNVVYFAAANDNPGVEYPCTSPVVVCAGGTTLRRDPSSLNFIQETAWVFTGGGYSAVEPKPGYQSSVGNNPTVWRGVPDVSMVADPWTGVYVYDTFPIYGYTYDEWIIVGGTSVSTAALAGIVNSAGAFAASSTAELNTMYGNRTNTSDFTDITVGYCGFYMGLPTLVHWDYCSGIGVPWSYAGK